ncbi:hypothetical protein ACHAWF_003917, partial [Thalassiosira exigua]
QRSHQISIYQSDHNWPSLAPYPLRNPAASSFLIDIQNFIMTSYEAIPSIDDEEGTGVVVTNTSGRLSTSPYKLILAVGGVLSVIFLAVGGNASVRGSPALSLAPSGGKAKKTAPCTFKECYASNCNPKVAPYTCLFHNGGPHGGCSPTEWVGASCTKSCDLTHCAGMDIPKDTESCDKPCKKAVCNGDRLCNSDAPYQCTSGSATFGCSVGKLEWTLKTSSGTCSSCCNANTCKD